MPVFTALTICALVLHPTWTALQGLNAERCINGDASYLGCNMIGAITLARPGSTTYIFVFRLMYLSAFEIAHPISVAKPLSRWGAG